MANNRLYIVDTETGEYFMLAKSMGAGWYLNLHATQDAEGGRPAPTYETHDEWAARLGAWLEDRDIEASYGNPSEKSTRLQLVAEDDLPPSQLDAPPPNDEKEGK